MADYLDAKAIGPDEDSTLKTELRHTNNFKRLLGKGSWFDLIGPSDLRDYIAQRSKEKGIRKGKVKGDTIRKEIQTFRQLWDFAASKQIVSGQNPVGQIKLPKKRKKPPFKTWEQIEVILERGGLDEEQTAELWDCLFLREAEIGKFLAHVKSQAQFRRYPFIYPALAFCAYTGARRSEMFRCQIGDVEPEVMLREKKGDKESEFTYRHVPLHQGLKAILDEHLKNHPGGQFMFVKDNGEPLEDRTGPVRNLVSASRKR